MDAGPELVVVARMSEALRRPSAFVEASLLLLLPFYFFFLNPPLGLRAML